MKYKKGKKITDNCQFKKGRKYTDEFTYEVLEFSHIGENGNPYFKDEGHKYFSRESEYNCIGFDLSMIDFYEAVEVTDTLDDKITELIELGRSKGLKINVTFE
jgi:hypothetical protein